MKIVFLSPQRHRGHRDYTEKSVKFILSYALSLDNLGSFAPDYSINFQRIVKRTEFVNNHPRTIVRTLAIQRVFVSSPSLGTFFAPSHLRSTWPSTAPDSSNSRMNQKIGLFESISTNELFGGCNEDFVQFPAASFIHRSAGIRINGICVRAKLDFRN